jgi:hypothetical protein
VSLAINHDESLVCAEFEILVSAIGIDGSELESFNVTGEIMPSSKNHSLLISNEKNIHGLFQYPMKLE